MPACSADCFYISLAEEGSNSAAILWLPPLANGSNSPTIKILVSYKVFLHNSCCRIASKVPAIIFRRKKTLVIHGWHIYNFTEALPRPLFNADLERILFFGNLQIGQKSGLHKMTISPSPRILPQHHVNRQLLQSARRTFKMHHNLGDVGVKAIS